MTSFTIRLSTSYNDSISDISVGRIEVLIDEEWASVCELGKGHVWGHAEAFVTCRQLGFRDGIPLGSGSAGFGPASQVPIYQTNSPCLCVCLCVFLCRSVCLSVCLSD